MLDGVDYREYTVIVKKAEEKETLAQTKILDHNRKQRSIFIANTPALRENPGKLLLFVLGENAIYEYFGILRKTANPNRVEISLFRGKEKEDRLAKRYDLCVEATVFDVKSPVLEEAAEDRVESVAEEQTVKLLNLSSTGVLIDTGFGVLQNEDTFKLKLDIAGNQTVILCKVVRVENTGDGNIRCGCKFIATDA